MLGGVASKAEHAMSDYLRGDPATRPSKDGRADRPILVVGFDKYWPVPIGPEFDGCPVLPANPASKLVSALEQSLTPTAFHCMSELAVTPEAPTVITGSAKEKNARAIVVFGAVLAVRGTMRLEQLARRRAHCWLPRLKGVREQLGVAPDFRVVDPRFIQCTEDLRGVRLGGPGSAGRHICNWTFYRLAAEDPPAVLVHLPPFRRLENRLHLARQFLDEVNSTFHG